MTIATTNLEFDVKPSSMNTYRGNTQFGLGFDELVVDNFAGGGGASSGIEQAIGRPVDIAINHDPHALAMHKVNHPLTKHYCESVWDVDPRKVCDRPVGLAWFSPDCKHHSKARGGKPVEKNIRGLAWVAIRWAATVAPRIIVIENVEEFRSWGPLVDGKPCPDRKGQTFASFVRTLKKHGYEVDHRELVAADYGAATSRKRFFLIARNDGQQIVWPEKTHGPGKPHAYKTAGDIIDWSLPCHSIFMTPEEAKAVGVRRPLAENTLRRIAKGIFKFVLDNPKPYIVRIGQTGFGGDRMQYPTDKPLTTVTSKAEHCLVEPFIAQVNHTASYYQHFRGQPLAKPLHTVTAKHGMAVCAAFLAKHYGGNYKGCGIDPSKPLHTVTAQDHHALVTSHLLKLKGAEFGHATNGPLPTVCSGGNHIGEVRAFLTKFYGQGTGQDLNGPLHAVTSKERFGLVTVAGENYQIVDIGMRMLQPHELFAAHNFPANYVIDRRADGTKVPKSRQVAAVGNSVPTDFARAIVSANYKQQETAIKQYA